VFSPNFQYLPQTLRIAFDTLGIEKAYEQRYPLATNLGGHELRIHASTISTILPRTFLRRMRVNVALNEESEFAFGLFRCAFPSDQFYPSVPTSEKIGPGIFSAPGHGAELIYRPRMVSSVVSVFFKRSFGGNILRFQDILPTSHHCIFNDNAVRTSAEGQKRS